MSPVEKPRAPGKSRKAGTKTLTLEWRRSGIGAPVKQKATLQGLGFRRLGERVVRPDDLAIRGMVRKVRHLVQIVEE